MANGPLYNSLSPEPPIMSLKTIGIKMGALSVKRSIIKRRMPFTLLKDLSVSNHRFSLEDSMQLLFVSRENLASVALALDHFIPKIYMFDLNSFI